MLIEKSPQVKEYLKVKGMVTVPAFLNALATNPSVRIMPHEGQQKIIEAYEERIAPTEESAALGLEFEYRYRVLSAFCGRRFGKSLIVSAIAAQELLVPNARVLICSYTLDNCEILFKSIRRLLVGLGIEFSVDRQRDMELVLKDNGATLRVASNDNVESRLGDYVTLLVLDEAKLFPKSLYEMILKPMLMDASPLSRTILISSPQQGWLEEYNRRGQSADFPDHWSINLPTHTNPAIPRQELISMEKTMPPDLYEQEVLGLFTSAAGLVCREFDREQGIFNPEEPIFEDYYLNSLLHEGNVIFHTIDSGYSHYLGSAHIVDVPHLDHLLLFHEYQKNKTLTSKHAEYFKDYETSAELEISLRYADPAASQQIADFAEYDLYFNKSEKFLRETITCLNTLFFQKSSVTGRPKLLISTDCPETIRQLSTVQWKEGLHDFQTKEQAAAGTKPFKPDVDKKTDWDLFDAIRYGLYSYVKNNKAAVFVCSADTTEEEEDDDETRMLKEHGFIKVGELN